MTAVVRSIDEPITPEYLQSGDTKPFEVVLEPDERIVNVETHFSGGQRGFALVRIWIVKQPR